MEENSQFSLEAELADEFIRNIQYRKATSGQRFFNWLIDNLLMRFGLSYLTGMIVGYLMNIFFHEYTMRILYDENTIDLVLIGVAIWIFNYLIYYTFCEKTFRGYTLGKLITGTRAIRDDGRELSWRDAFLRSLSRLIPFEVWSGFGTPWHDSLTNTCVIKVRYPR